MTAPAIQGRAIPKRTLAGSSHIPEMYSMYFACWLDFTAWGRITITIIYLRERSCLLVYKHAQIIRYAGVLDEKNRSSNRFAS